MGLIEAVIEGTIQPDGSLVLDEPTKLPAGRVTVVLRQENGAEKSPQNWFEFMVSARRKMEDVGCHFMDDNEVTKHIDSLREEDRIDKWLQESNFRGQHPE